ncbi:MAG: hypothetical protein KGV56_00350 [Gammaproteobacteria bacterium]|nr:hypothetical protein [Gammaproteobacteria bacterium]
MQIKELEREIERLERELAIERVNHLISQLNRTFCEREDKENDYYIVFNENEYYEYFGLEISNKVSFPSLLKPCVHKEVAKKVIEMRRKELEIIFEPIANFEIV